MDCPFEGACRDRPRRTRHMRRTSCTCRRGPASPLPPSTRLPSAARNVRIAQVAREPWQTPPCLAPRHTHTAVVERTALRPPPFDPPPLHPPAHAAAASLDPLPTSTYPSAANGTGTCTQRGRRSGGMTPRAGRRGMSRGPAREIVQGKGPRPHSDEPRRGPGATQGVKMTPRRKDQRPGWGERGGGGGW